MTATIETEIKLPVTTGAKFIGKAEEPECAYYQIDVQTVKATCPELLLETLLNGETDPVVTLKNSDEQMLNILAGAVIILGKKRAGSNGVSDGKAILTISNISPSAIQLTVKVRGETYRLVLDAWISRAVTFLNSAMDRPVTIPLKTELINPMVPLKESSDVYQKIGVDEETGAIKIRKMLIVLAE